MKIKTIDLNAKEWFDKINGNSYFSCVITLNYGKEEKTLNLTFQYGYGSQYEHESFTAIKKELKIKTDIKTLWRYCDENNIILRTNKINCLKGDLIK